MIKMMLTRNKEWSTSTTGSLSISKDGEILYECKTVENLKEGKERNKDLRVPQGVYKLGLRQSPRFGKTPHLFNAEVPKDRYILMHKGNTDRDTEGCIILGTTIENGCIKGGTSKPAFDKVMEILNREISDLNVYDRCELQIVNKF
ncbi:TPA: hypothetical protein RTG63_001659 [Campylobacter jejuni]|nr:hypothetical protein [Campylobacter jejuni]